MILENVSPRAVVHVSRTSYCSMCTMLATLDGQVELLFLAYIQTNNPQLTSDTLGWPTLYGVLSWLLYSESNREAPIVLPSA
jgi:hypothetical protein